MHQKKIIITHLFKPQIFENGLVLAKATDHIKIDSIREISLNIKEVLRKNFGKDWIPNPKPSGLFGAIGYDDGTRNLVREISDLLSYMYAQYPILKETIISLEIAKLYRDNGLEFPEVFNIEELKPRLEETILNMK